MRFSLSRIARRSRIFRLNSGTYDGANQGHDFMSIRELCGVGSYYECNREERNLAAIVYHLLLQKSRVEVQEFLKCLKVEGSDWAVDSESKEPDGFGIYFEYAFLRDAWNHIGRIKNTDGKMLDPCEQDKRRRAILRELLMEGDIWQKLELDDKTTPGEFNAVFNSARGNHSKIHSPASWTAFHDSIFPEKPIEKIKWAFNAKPDLVIHTSSEHAICFEFKLESGVSNYAPEFSQLLIQEKIFTMLGFETKFFCIRKTKGSSEGATVKTWKELFDCLLPQESDKEKLPRYVRAALVSAGVDC
jgi:hypothetical protein